MIFDRLFLSQWWLNTRTSLLCCTSVHENFFMSVSVSVYPFVPCRYLWANFETFFLVRACGLRKWWYWKLSKWVKWECEGTSDIEAFLENEWLSHDYSWKYFCILDSVLWRWGDLLMKFLHMMTNHQYQLKSSSLCFSNANELETTGIICFLKRRKVS